ncbi:MAG: ABC transporter permease [Gammaproteobacteria bacterium]|nr:ABC transporter permease [Gammaproteobacteria bacterium]
MNNISLALRFLRRDWRAGELTVLMLALIIAVASVTSVSFFTDRIHQALQSQANDLLGGDLVLQSGELVTAERLQQLAASGLQSATTAEFPTMALSGERSQLVALKAVSKNYPLRGQHRIAPNLFVNDAATEGGPAPGTVWAESRLLSELGIDVGAEISVGATQLKVAAVLTSEPDQSEGTMFNIAPRLLMNSDDLAATALIQPASRVHYRLLIAGDSKAVARLRMDWQQHLAPGETLQGVEDARPEVRTALARGESFLGLAALVSVLLAGTAVAMAARRFVSRHLDNCAVMRCLGAEQKFISRLYLQQMLFLGVVASAIGIVIGFVAQSGLVVFLGPLAGVNLPAPGAWPVVWGLLTGMITLLGFAMPPMLQLTNVPTLRVLRRDLGPPRINAVLAYGFGLGAFLLLVIVQAQNLKLALAVVLGLVLLAGLLALLAAGLLFVLRTFKRGGSAWRLGLSNLSRRANHSIVQMIGFGIGLMALLLLVVVRSDLLEEWQGRLPEDTPNRFLINIQPDQLKPLQDFFKSEAVDVPLLYPMVRARLVEINGRPVSMDDFPVERAKRLVNREFNLSWAEQLQDDNQIIAGHWWQASDFGKALFSVEEGLAKELGLKLGDTLTYSAGGQRFSAEITSLRSVKWDSFRANFFVLAPPGMLDAYPVNYITGFYLPLARHDVLNRLVRQFPNITVLDVGVILDQVRSIINRVTLAVEYVFLFTLSAGLMVLYAAIHATLDERIHEAAILRTLGARRGQILGSIVLEYAGLGLLSGLVASVAAGVVGMILAERVFELSYVPGPSLWLGGMLVGAIGVGLAGTLGTKHVLNQPPLQTLRNV